MKTTMLLFSLCLAVCGCTEKTFVPVPSASDLQFNVLAKTWDEGIPLGNATIGALVWQRDSALRFSLDRTDLWDLRPSDSLAGPRFRFDWVRGQVAKKDYLPVQKKFDWPYDRNPAPSKIPGAAFELSLEKEGAPSAVRLYLKNALCEATWENGMRMQTFVHATRPVGWFSFEKMKSTFMPALVAPPYNRREGTQDAGPVSGLDLRRLGYEQGTVEQGENWITYHQKGWGDFHYDVAVCWKQAGDRVEGTWSVTSSMGKEQAFELAREALGRGMASDYREHAAYWEDFHAQSSVSLPDTVLQKQYDNEMYKFGSASREDSYPISLQAVWTADNGKLPPWKGDYHHDLNTQLSYWPCYAGNHLREGLGYLNTLWNQREVYRAYTRQYFGTEGLNIPGVCTLTGQPMGGWIQYSFSQTVGAWLAQHFYLHWKYSADRRFLKERAYPFLKETATFLEQISTVDAAGVRKLEIGSSPEIFDNSLQAWFHDMTNYDLSLMRFAFGAASELASELQLEDEAAHWKTLEGQLPDFDVDEEGCLTFAPGTPYQASHRHFSHAMAFHPLGLIDWSQGEKSQRIIRATLKRLDEVGPDYWCGYSYSWLGNMKARAFDGEGAAEALRTFAECFCLANTFHANGDQTRSGKSRFTYRPFTLEGNFAFAAGIQEMLLQSHTGVIRVFPAIPAGWREVSFDRLRAMGAFLVSAVKEEGEVRSVRIYPEQGGICRIASPFGNRPVKVDGQEGPVSNENGLLSFATRKGETVMLSPE